MKIITFLIILLTINVTFAQQTMPVDYTITDTQERTLTGTILEKTDTHITFQRQQDKKKFKIEINTLSEKDKAFIAPLIKKEDKKPKVLIYTHRPYEDVRDTMVWLVVEGFDVTYGGQLTYQSDTSDVNPNFETLYITNPELIDKFDVLWIPEFKYKKNDKIENSQAIVVEYAQKKNKLTVINTNFGHKDPKNYRADFPWPNDEKPKYAKKPYVEKYHNFIFYKDIIKASNAKPGVKDSKIEDTLDIRDEVVARVKRELSR